MRRRPSVDVVSTSIRRQLNVNSTPTLKQRQFNTCMTPMSVQCDFYAYDTLMSIRHQLNDVSVDNMLVDVSMHHIRRTCIILYLRR